MRARTLICPQHRGCAVPARCGLTFSSERVGALYGRADAVQGHARGPQHAANAEEQLAQEVLGLGVAPQLCHWKHHGAARLALGCRSAQGLGQRKVRSRRGVQRGEGVDVGRRMLIKALMSSGRRRSG
jgi:hypothetical protein